MDKVIVIAEAGPNHNGKIKLAYKLVNLAKSCGADFVKFQTSVPEAHISKFARKAKYQIKNTKKNQSQLEMSKKMTLSYEQFKLVKKFDIKVIAAFAKRFLKYNTRFSEDP